MKGIIIRLLLSVLLLTVLNSNVYAQYNPRVQRNSTTYTLDDFYVRRRNVNTDRNEKSEKKKKNKEKKNTEKENTSSQEPLAADDVSLVVSGEGPTKDEATKVALRSAIEQAFGTFVSSNTNILNDELVKDEIVTVSSGNIKSYEYISEDNSNGKYNVVVKAVVSIGKLVSYTQSKGGQTELAGATFIMDVKMKKLYRENERKAFDHLWLQLRELFPQMFDYSINVGELRRNERGVNSINVTVAISTNNNYQVARSMIWKTLSALCIKTENEVEDLERKGMTPTFCTFYGQNGAATTDLPLKFFKSPYRGMWFGYDVDEIYEAYFRSKKIVDICYLLNNVLEQFTIDWGTDKTTFTLRRNAGNVGGRETYEFVGKNGSFRIDDDVWPRSSRIIDKYYSNERLKSIRSKPIHDLTTQSCFGFIDGPGFFEPFPVSNSFSWKIKGTLRFTDDELEKISTFKVFPCQQE